MTELTRAPLQVSLTAASDTSDLLGSYEQAEPSRASDAAEQRLLADARAACAAAAATGAFEAAAAATDAWHAYTSVVAASGLDSAERSAALQVACAATSAAAAVVSPAAVAAWSASLAAFSEFSNAGAPGSATGSFEWVDGVLLKAMASGDWVLLDNANLCSPTVLDRLNPLLEPAGELLVPEAGLVGGAPLIAMPAPGFRLLLALDPSHGEVSRAMRNRGIEVFMLHAGQHIPTVRIRPVTPGSDAHSFHPRTRSHAAFGRACRHLGPRPNSAHNDSGQGVWPACVWPRQPAQRVMRICSSPGCCVHPAQAHLKHLPVLMQLCPTHLQDVSDAERSQLPWGGSLPAAQLDAAAVMCHAGLHAGPATRAVLPAIQALAAQSRPGLAWPTLREAAAFSRLLYQLLGRGWSAAGAAETAWRRAYGGHGELFDASVARSFPLVADARDSPVRPLLWPSQLSVHELADCTQLTSLRREAATLEAALAASVSAAAASAFGAQPEQTFSQVSAWVRAFPAAAALLPEPLLLSCLATGSVSVGDCSLPESADGSALLRCAALLYLESCSPMDADRRALLLQSLTERLEPPDAVWTAPFCELRTYAAAATELATNAAVALVHTARLRAAAARGRLLVQSPPYDLDAGVTLADARAELGRHDGPPQDEQAASCAALMTCETILSATCRMLVSGAHIASQQAAAARCVSTFLHLALARAAAPDERMRRAPAHALLDVLPHVFAAVAALEAAITSACSSWMRDALATEAPGGLGSVTHASACLLKELDSLAEWRSRCVTILNDSECAAPLPVETLILAWLRMQKQLSRITTLLESAHVGDAAVAAASVAASAMDACCGITELRAPKPLLWRFAGHPSLPADRHMHELESELRLLAESPSLAHDPGLRAALSQAVCFFSWSHVGAEHDAPKLSLSDAAPMHALALAKVTAAQLKPESSLDAVDRAPQQAEVDAAADASCDAESAFVTGAAEAAPWSLSRWKTAAEAASGLRDLADLASLTASLPLLATLSTASCSDATPTDVAAALPAATMAALLRFGLSATGRSPLDFAPLQQIIWLSERMHEDSAAAMQLKRALPAASHELWFRFHAAAWTSPLAGGNAPSWTASAGTAPLFRPAATAKLLSLASAASGVAVVERPAVLLQLRLAARGVRRGARLSAAPDAHSAQFPASADRQAVHALSVQLMLAYAGAFPPLGKAAALLSGCDGGAAAASAELESAATAQRMPPVFSALLAPLAAALDFHGQPGSPGDEASRGAAWAHLGCARLALLAAELVADPAARDAFKLDHVRSRRSQELEPELQLRASAAALPGARAFERGLYKCQTAIARADAVVGKLVVRAVPRPATSTWLPARAEIERFVLGLGCVPLCAPPFRLRSAAVVQRKDDTLAVHSSVTHTKPPTHSERCTSGAPHAASLSSGG